MIGVFANWGYGVGVWVKVWLTVLLCDFAFRSLKKMNCGFAVSYKGASSDSKTFHEQIRKLVIDSYGVDAKYRSN